MYEYTWHLQPPHNQVVFARFASKCTVRDWYVDLLRHLALNFNAFPSGDGELAGSAKQSSSPDRTAIRNREMAHFIGFASGDIEGDEVNADKVDP